MRWRRRASYLGRFTLWHNGRRASYLGRFTLGTTAAELQNSVDLLCGTTAAELQNSVDLLCGTTAAELQNSVDLLCGCDGRLSQLSKTLRTIEDYHNSAKHWTDERRGPTKNVTKRLKARQKCVDDENAISKNLPLLIAQDTQQCTEHSTQIRGCVLVPRTQ